MTIFQSGRHAFQEVVAENFNVNDSDETTARIEMVDSTDAVIQVVKTSGTVTACIIEAQCSVDGTNWASMDESVTGEGAVNVTVHALAFRAKVRTREGVPGTATVTIQVK